MNIMLQDFARSYLKLNIRKVDDDCVHKFKQMYSHGHMDKHIDTVIDDMDTIRLDHAMVQVRNSIQ